MGVPEILAASWVSFGQLHAGGLPAVLIALAIGLAIVRLKQ